MLNKIIKKCLLIFSALIFCLMSYSGKIFFCDKISASASDPQEDINQSIFINSPSYSFVKDNKIYFIDSTDNLLKVYDTVTGGFLSDYLDLSFAGTVIDAVYIDEKIILLSSNLGKNHIYEIDLNYESLIAKRYWSNESKTVELVFGGTYSGIFARNIGENLYFVISPTSSSNSSYALIFDVNTSENYIISETRLLINHEYIGITKSIKKLLLAPSSDSSLINLVAVSDCGLFGITLQKSSLSGGEMELDNRSFFKPIESTNFDKNIYESLTVSGVSIASKDGSDYIFITYLAVELDGTISSYTVISRLFISMLGNGSVFHKLTSFVCPTTDFVCLSGNFISYPENQTLSYAYVNLSETSSSVGETKAVSNPNLTISYYDEDSFIYMYTTSSAKILSSPWNSNEIIQIPAGSDLIVIGKGVIVSQNLVIEDYKYCLFTYNNKNYEGYVKTQNLALKQKKVVDTNREYSVVPKTVLYSMPTKVLNDKITDRITSIALLKISDSEKIKIVDSIGYYNSNGSVFIRVSVSGKIGYIETSQIQDLTALNIYIINNATIKEKTELYETENKLSKSIVTIEKGSRVRVTGSRNKETGMTPVDYSDEYGNVFSGYVLSDYVSSDGWSTMQILGSILIAVNIGIFVFIIYFVRKRISVNDSSNKNNEEVSD